MMKRFLLRSGVLFAIVLAAHGQVLTDVPPPVAGSRAISVEHVTVRGDSLSGNLEGNATEREVIVLLPPGYRRSPARRYPVVYALHGYSIGARQWTGEIHVPQTAESAFALGAREMIIVLPDSKTVHNGSLYSNSVTTGDFEDFIARDVVAYVDTHYRTLRNRRSRGLAGHSMGGYGTLRIGMKHPDVFGSLYAMSPCCLSVREFSAADIVNAAPLEAITQPAQSEALPFMLRAQLASAAAWSPDPQRPPLYLELPIKNGALQPAVLQKWAANAPLAMLDQYVGPLRAYHGIAIDVGDQDSLKDDAARFHTTLDSYGVANNFDIYPGTHTSAVADRFQNHLLPFMSQQLCFESKCP